MKHVTKAALTLAAIMTMVAASATLAGPALAKPYPPPSIHLACTAAPTDGALHGSVCALAPGQTTAPDSYSATIAASKAGAAGPAVTFALTSGSLPPGLSMSPSSGTASTITGNPAQAGTFNFTIKATDGGLTATQAYQITITVQGPPDELVCDPAGNGGFLENGVCVLPDAVTGQSYQGHLVTSHKAGGALSVVSGSLPAGLSLPAAFTGSGDTVGGTPATVSGGSTFTVQGTGDQGQPLYQTYSIAVDPNQPLSITLPAIGSALSPGMVGGAYAQNFFLSGGAGPYTWSVASGQLPPGVSLRTFSDPRDASDELAGTPTMAGTYAFTMRLTDYNGQQATQAFTLTIDPPLQITTTALPSGTVGVPYSHDLDLTAHGGTPPYNWFVVDNINELPPGLTLDTTSPDFNNVLAGTPTQAGTFTFPMQVQDSQDNWTSATLTITINR